MGSKRKIKVGDNVLCIQELHVPKFIGHVWKVIEIDTDNGLYYCINHNMIEPEYVFRLEEIAINSSLIRELL